MKPNIAPADQIAPKGMRIGHVHLHVSDIEHSVAFYRDVIGFNLIRRIGDDGAFLSVDGYHHHLGLNTWGTKGMKRDGVRRPGLYHFALNYPTQRDLALAVQRVLKAGYSIDGASDHHTHLAVYISDPDGNGIELAWDRDPSFWGEVMDPDVTIEEILKINKRLDVRALIADHAPLPA
jgi:catechol 2,3-dioxygenase